MGEANRRGTFQERQKIAVEKKMKLVRDRAAALETYMANETQEQKNKRISQQTLLTSIIGLTAGARSHRTPTETPQDFLIDN